jgi:hypothetical protein
MDAQQRAELLLRLRHDGSRIARHFDLRYKSIDAERKNVKSRYGHCTDEGRIKIRLNHVRTGNPLKYSSLIDTLCHELAHLKHFDHGPQFKDFFWELLQWARKEGIYQPKRRGQAAVAPGPAAAPRAPKLELRNGVPVFLSPREVYAQNHNNNAVAPWERWAETLNINVGKRKPRRAGRKTKGTGSASGDHKAKTPREAQLSLF